MDDVFAPVLEWLRSLSASASGALDVIEAVDPSLRTLVAGVGAMLEMFVVTGLLVPGDTIVLVAASAVSSPLEGVLLGVVIAVGALLGEIASYGLGWWIGTTARGARVRRHAGEARISSARRFLMERGGPAILAARFIPVLRTVMPFVVGLSGFSFRRFLAWSIPASIGWSVIYVTIYALAAAPLREGNGSLLLSLGLALLGFVVFGVAYLLQFLWSRSQRSALDPTAAAETPTVPDATEEARS